MTYAIRVTDARTGNKLDLCHVGTNPEPVAAAARLKTYTIPAATKLRFWHVTPLWDAASFLSDRRHSSILNLSRWLGYLQFRPAELCLWSAQSAAPTPEERPHRHSPEQWGPATATHHGVDFG